MRRTVARALLAVALAATSARGDAPSPAAPPPAPPLDLKPVVGPAPVELGHGLALALPTDFLYLDAPQAQKVLAAVGNVPGPHLLGLVGKERANWFIEIAYVEEGWVRDDEAEKLDGNAILDAIRRGTEEANKLRAKGGFPPIHVEGWAAPPRYERASHRLVWAVKGGGADGAVVNYNTRLLGRRGYASLNLVVDPGELAAAKADVAALVAVTRFTAGARYEDFQEKRDRVAEYGLAALVAGGAGAAALKLVKVGMIAKFWGVIVGALVAGKKLLLLALAALAASFRRLFGRKKGGAPAAGGVPSAGEEPTEPAAPPEE